MDSALKEIIELKNIQIEIQAMTLRQDKIDHRITELENWKNVTEKRMDNNETDTLLQKDITTDIQQKMKDLSISFKEIENNKKRGFLYALFSAFIFFIFILFILKIL